MSTMSQVVATALDKLPTHERPASGSYRGKAVVTVAFNIRVGEDYEKTVPSAIPWQRLFAVAISKVNEATLKAIVEEAMAGEIPGEADITRRAAKAVERMVAKTQRTVKGPVTGDCYVVEVNGFELNEGMVAEIQV